MKKIVLTFGRMNPPTLGHEKVVAKVEQIAKSQKAIARIYLSHSQNSKTDPLEYNQKLRYARAAFGSVITKSNDKTIVDILKSVQREGFTDVCMVVGSDRVDNFNQFLNSYNGEDYTFDSIETISAGQRDQDAQGVVGISASKMRLSAIRGDFDGFERGCPSKLPINNKIAMYNNIRKVMINE